MNVSLANAGEISLDAAENECFIWTSLTFSFYFNKSKHKWH